MTEEKVSKKPERIQKMFDQVASRYDFLNHFLSVGIDFYWRRKTIRQLAQRLKNANFEANPSKRIASDGCYDAPILDVAAGTGDLSIGLFRYLYARHVLKQPQKLSNAPASKSSEPRTRNSKDLESGSVSDPGKDPDSDRCLDAGSLAVKEKRSLKDLSGLEYDWSDCQIVGVDFAAEMLQIARTKCRKNGFDKKILFATADGLALPFADDLFAAVTIAFGLRNMADTDQGIAEMVRVCRPDGWVAILEFTMPDAPLIAPLYRFYFRRILPLLGRFISKNREDAYNYLPSSVLEFDNAQQMTERLKKAGLENIAVCPMTFKTATLYLGQKKADH